MDWRAAVELFEQIRREYEHGEETIAAWRVKSVSIGGWCGKP
ncbi:MAG TPA: hypothetical protein VFZ27_04880 [Terriglobia bacterium]|nr:hypothetical protein [Terriglobia bacterium]